MPATLTVSSQFLEQDENYAHIEEAEMAKVQNKVEEGMSWLNKRMQEFQKTLKHQTPTVSPSQILNEKKVCIYLLRWSFFGMLTTT